MMQIGLFANSWSAADGVNFSAVRTQIHFFCALWSLLSVGLLGEAIAANR
jgi:hypothetical protein